MKCYGDVWRCIRWVQEAFPPGGDCSGLILIYEQCVRAFWHSDRYKDDLRYLKVWLEYVGFYWFFTLYLSVFSIFLEILCPDENSASLFLLGWELCWCRSHLQFSWSKWNWEVTFCLLLSICFAYGIQV